MFCESCGTTLDNTASFCTSCGAAVVRLASRQSGQAEPQLSSGTSAEVPRSATQASARGRSALAIPAAMMAAVIVTGVVLYATGVIGGSEAPTTVVATTIAEEVIEEVAEEVMEVTWCGPLVVGTILPVTGTLAFLGPPMIAAADLAAEDINLTGSGRFRGVELYQGDSGDTSTDTADTEVDRLLASGAHVIVGAASSAVSLTVIDKITSAGVVQFSPANSSPELTTYPDNGLFFRTAPSDVTQARILAKLVAEDGGGLVSVLYRDDDYGRGIFDEFFRAYFGGGINGWVYSDSSFENEVAMVGDSDAVVIIGFEESAEIIQLLDKYGFSGRNGFGPSIYLADGGMYGLEKLVDDPTILNGVQGVVPEVDFVNNEMGLFTRRLDAYGVDDGYYSYGALTYDAIVISALAAQLAGCDESGSFDGTTIAANIPRVTGDGEKCYDYINCQYLIESGVQIDFQGLGGPYDFDANGDPVVASFRVATYGFDGVDTTRDRYYFSS